MKKLIIFVFAILLNGIANADQIPVQLKKSIMGFDVKKIDLENKVLKIVLNRAIVSQDTYQTIIRVGVCSPLWTDSRHGWENVKLDRIEVLNTIQGQGYAFIGGKKTCNELGNTKGLDEKNYIDSNTWVCVAGFSCRPRRDGEKISGD